MSELFSGASDAASAQTAGINKGLTSATGQIGQGQSALNTDYASALAPFQQNYTQAQQGTTAIANLQGLNGASAGRQAQQALQATPGYQYTLGQANNATNAAAAANGTLGSGNQALALQKNASGLASQNYNSYVSQLQPYLGASQSAAGGIAGVQTGLANQTNANYGTLANLNYGADTSIANAQASADLANQSMDMNLLGGGINLVGSIFSDERLKESIEPVGELYDGTNVYRYRYKGDDTPRIGVLAQEVEKTRPDAVSEHGGYLAVDYGRATQMSAELARFFDKAA
jgi:hypothetical protein